MSPVPIHLVLQRGTDIQDPCAEGSRHSGVEHALGPSQFESNRAVIDDMNLVHRLEKSFQHLGRGKRKCKQSLE
jgi:hypothetical protein